MNCKKPAMQEWKFKKTHSVAVIVAYWYRHLINNSTTLLYCASGREEWRKAPAGGGGGGGGGVARRREIFTKYITIVRVAPEIKAGDAADAPCLRRRRRTID